MNNYKMVHLPGIPTLPKRFYKFSFYSTSVTVFAQTVKNSFEIKLKSHYKMGAFSKLISIVYLTRLFRTRVFISYYFTIEPLTFGAPLHISCITFAGQTLQALLHNTS